MKKFLLLLLVFVPMLAMGQRWDTHYVPADELKGESEYYSYIYHGATNDYFVYWSNDSEIKVGSSRGIFDYSDSYVSAIIGFYEDDKLVDKVTARMFVPKGDSNTAFTSEYRDPGLGKRIIDWINNTGDVRFIIPKYSGSDFDLRVPKKK